MRSPRSSDSQISTLKRQSMSDASPQPPALSLQPPAALTARQPLRHLLDQTRRARLPLLRKRKRRTTRQPSREPKVVRRDRRPARQRQINAARRAQASPRRSGLPGNRRLTSRRRAPLAGIRLERPQGRRVGRVRETNPPACHETSTPPHRRWLRTTLLPPTLANHSLLPQPRHRCLGHVARPRPLSHAHPNPDHHRPRLRSRLATGRRFGERSVYTDHSGRCRR